MKKKEKRATLWNLFGLFGARKPKAEATPTPAVTPPPEPTATALIHVPRVPTTAAPVAALPALVAPAPAPAPIQESDVRKALDWFSAHRDLVDKALAPGRIFYQGRDTQTYGVHSKTFGQNDAIRLPDNDVNSWTPRLSLDRRTLYLKMSDRTDNSTHFVALTAGEEPKDLIRIAGSVGYYDVSPDKTEIAFTTKQENLNHVYRLRFEGGEPIRFSDETVGGVFPAYAPDGKTIAYCASKKLRLKDIATGEEKIVVGDDLAKELPAWSPDGKWITYQASAGDEFSYDIYKVNVETGEVVRLTKEPGIDANPCFSADGAKIAFMSERETGNGNQTLYVMDADGSNVTRDPTSKPGIYFPRW